MSFHFKHQLEEDNARLKKENTKLKKEDEELTALIELIFNTPELRRASNPNEARWIAKRLNKCVKLENQYAKLVELVEQVISSGPESLVIEILEEKLKQIKEGE